MASYTTNLNLEMPTVNEKYDVLKQNTNWQKVDEFAGNVNEQVANIDSTTIITNLDNIPVNSQGFIRLDSSISPYGLTGNIAYQCFGQTANNMTIIAVRLSTGAMYINVRYSGTWGGWKTVNLT